MHWFGVTGTGWLEGTLILGTAVITPPPKASRTMNTL